MNRCFQTDAPAAAAPKVGAMRTGNRQVVWGAILALVVVAVLLAIFAGTVGAIVCAVVAVALALFSSGLRRG